MGNRYVKFGKQTQWGVTVAGVTFVDIISESIGHERNLNLPLTVGFKTPSSQSVGKYGPPNGNMEMLNIPDDIGYFLAMTFGDPVSAQQGGTACYRHRFTPRQTVLYYTMAIGKEGLVRIYNSTFSKSWTMSMEAGGPAMNTFGVLARSDEIGVDEVPTFNPYRNHLHATQGTIQIGGITYQIKAIELNFNYNPEDDKFNIGSQFLAGAVRKDYSVELTLDIWFDDETQLQRFYDGVVNPGGLVGDSPGNTITEFPITIDIVGDTIVAPWTYRLYIDIPKAVFDSENSNMTTREHVIQNLKVKAIHDAGIEDAIRVDLYNRRTGY